MKEKILCAGVGAVGFIILRGLAEYVITEAHWPQFAKDIGLFFTQNHPVLWVAWGGLGALIGWNVPVAFGERRENLSLDTISRQERGSAKIAILGLMSTLAIGVGVLATEMGQPTTDVLQSLPKGGERIVSGVINALTNPGR